MENTSLPNDEALVWDDREGLRGTENKGFTRPPADVLEYAKSHNLHLNIWSIVVQRAIRIRIALENKS